MINLKSLEDCKLKIGHYPTFTYNAKGGGGNAEIVSTKKNGDQDIIFDPNKFNIPNLNFITTSILGIPLLPGLEIVINTEELSGNISVNENTVNLSFNARFRLQIFNVIKAPDLIIKTFLSNKMPNNKRTSTTIQNRTRNSIYKLTGRACVKKTGNMLLDTFLNLPTEAEAILNCEITQIS